MWLKSIRGFRLRSTWWKMPLWLYNLALWRQIRYSTLAEYCHEGFASDPRIIMPPRNSTCGYYLLYENTQPKSLLRYFVVYKILHQINHGKRKLVDFSILQYLRWVLRGDSRGLESIRNLEWCSWACFGRCRPERVEITFPIEHVGSLRRAWALEVGEKICLIDSGTRRVFPWL